MLEFRPNCECCNKDLPPSSSRARICSFERTFCESCAERSLGNKCPGCGGELTPRPRRATKYLAEYPPSTVRVYEPERCAKVAARRARTARA